MGKMGQGVRVGKRVAITDFATMNDFAYCQFDNLAADGARNFRYGGNDSGYVTRAGSLADSLANPGLQGIRQCFTCSEYHKQHYSHVTLPFLSYDNGFADLIQGFYLAVNLCGTDPHTSRIEHCI